MTTQTVSSPDPSFDQPLRPRGHLFITLSCAHPLDPPSRHGLEGVHQVCIGRGDVRSATRSDGGRVLTLTLADRHASSAHARLVRHPEGWVLDDVGSKNGTFVNGARTRTATLSDGDWAQIGHTLLRFRAALPTPMDAPTDLVATARIPALATLIPTLAQQLGRVAAVADSAVPILLVSETGTGKEVLAGAIHELSRRPGSLIPIHCGGLPSTLVESVLFGHKRGSFSGAVSDHPGLFRAACGGTLLLDEVGDMPLPVQVAVLRALQDGEILPVGATCPLRVDVRIVGATHHDLEARVEDGRFRDDLMARLSGFTFRLPPLRERIEDIGLFVCVLLRRWLNATDAAPALSPEAGWRLIRHAWPRNVRELEKCLHQAIAIAGERRIELDCLPEPVRDGVAKPPRRNGHELCARLTSLMAESGGNVSHAAGELRTSRSQVRRWLKRFGVDPNAFRH